MRLRCYGAIKENSKDSDYGKKMNLSRLYLTEFSVCNKNDNVTKSLCIKHSFNFLVPFYVNT
jgi:hypothetical protein